MNFASLFYTIGPDRVARRVGSLDEYADWRIASGPDACRVASDMIGKMYVSTIFLGFDHRHVGKGPPLLFETMTFDKDGKPMEQWRCSTWEEAEAQHAEAKAALQHSHLRVVK